MNKKIISFTLALVFIVQPIALLADTQPHPMNKEQLIKELEDKVALQKKKIETLCRVACELENNNRPRIQEYVILRKVQLVALLAC